MRCMNCGHKISSHESIQRKFGPKCARRLGIIELIELDFDEPRLLPERFRGLTMLEQHREAMRVLRGRE